MREHFLAAILAAPDDDGPRLVYADYLEEQGEVERAELIRFSVTNPEDFEENGYPNCRGILGVPVVLGFYLDRGFIHTIRGPLAAILEHGPGICQEQPVQAVEVTDRQPLQHGDAYWLWWTGDESRFELPSEIASRVSIGEMDFTEGYSSEQSAIDGLNAAVLATIRERARGMVAG